MLAPPHGCTAFRTSFYVYFPSKKSTQLCIRMKFADFGWHSGRRSSLTERPVRHAVVHSSPHIKRVAFHRTFKRAHCAHMRHSSRHSLRLVMHSVHHSAAASPFTSLVRHSGRHSSSPRSPSCILTGIPPLDVRNIGNSDWHSV